ncbi:hypothetical protein MO867_13525 [Microbulbifer sp. OS29]|uniref:Uncharacterized protein n=1 Tax=Microbulbifer okhotskensis TaxID=2926617 RepID=A0A9X2J5M2_9GAMM|nr:hypothetical protein [Microbulbifer okhotskensis]MCO1335353.1 hypothetical protein [Microbulbifer okhotskensis]
MFDEKYIVGGAISILFFLAWNGPKLYREKITGWVILAWWMITVSFLIWDLALIVVEHKLTAVIDEKTLSVAKEAVDKIEIPLRWWIYLGVIFAVDILLWVFSKYRLEDMLESKS